MKAVIDIQDITEQPTDLITKRLMANSRVCMCCEKDSTIFIKIGREEEKYAQVTTIPLCKEHSDELKSQLGLFL